MPSYPYVTSSVNFDSRCGWIVSITGDDFVLHAPFGSTSHIVGCPKCNPEGAARHSRLCEQYAPVHLRFDENKGVYILKTEDGLYKIGCSKDIRSRTKEIIAASSHKTMHLHSISAIDPKVAEQHLHGKYASRRVRGEWFKLTQEDISFIRSISRFDKGQFC